MTLLYVKIKSMDKYDVSLILACYNEVEVFEDSVERIVNALNKTDYTWEIIFVDDKSQDSTVKLIKKVLKKYSRQNLSVIYHQQNQGRGQTVVDGFQKAKGKFVGYIDIDLETSEWYMPQFFEALEQGADVVLAWRIYDFQLRALPRWIGSKGYVILRKLLLGLPYQDTEGGYKFFRRSKIAPLLKKVKHQGWFFDTEIMTLCFKYNLKVKEIPVAFIRRFDKTSTVKFIPDTIEYLKNLVKFSLEFKK
ncbi:glycosyltransferase [Patescibacteria group bacterium]